MATDGGVGVDAQTPRQNAGSPLLDAGATDAGSTSPATDAGAPGETDAGSRDAGAPADSGSVPTGPLTLLHFANGDMPAPCESFGDGTVAVLDSGGRPAAGVAVTLHANTGVQIWNDADTTPRSDVVVVTGSDGRALYHARATDDAPGSTVTVSASAPGASPENARYTVYIRVARSIELVSGPTMPLARGGAVDPPYRVRLRGTCGNPVPAHEVTLSGTAGFYCDGLFSTTSATTDASGIATCTLATPAAQPTGTYDIGFSAAVPFGRPFTPFAFRVTVVD